MKSEPDDTELMMRIASGDERAFEMLVERHQALVMGVVMRMLRRKEDAEEIAQEVFVRAWRSASRYQPSSKFTTWLLTIARNLVFNAVRDNRHHARSVSMDEDDPARQWPDPGTRSPAQEHADKELREAVDAAIESLPPQQRLALILRRYDGLAYEDIAQVLQTSVPAVKSLLFRAREDLRHRLAHWLADETF